MSKDFYAILGVQKGASDDEIKKAFRRAAHEHHPDKGGDAAKFKDVNEAYQVLSDPQKRKMYDQFGSAAFEQGGPGAGGPGFGGFGGQGFGGFDFRQGGFEGQDLGDLGDILGEMFGFAGGRGQGSSRRARGKDIEVDVELTFKEAAFGLEKAFRLYRYVACSKCHGDGAEPGTKVIDCLKCGGSGQVRQQQRTMFGTIQTATACPDCHGRGKKPEKECSTCKGTGLERREESVTIAIPPGMSSGEALKITGQGEAAPYGGTSGDLYLRVRVKTDPKFDRDDHDVLSELSVPFTVLTLGGKVDVDTLDGKETLSIPDGTTPGTVFTLRGKGIAYARGSRGDQRVMVTTETPRKLTKEQRKLLEQLREQGL